MAYAEMTVGTFDRKEIRGVLNLPLLPDTLLLRLSGVTADRTGYAVTRDFATGRETGETGDEHRRALRSAFRWQPSGRTTVDFVIDHVREDQHAVPTTLLQFDDDGVYGGVPAALWNTLIGAPSGLPMSSAFVTADLDSSYATGPNLSALNASSIAVTLDTAIGDVELRSISAYRAFQAAFGRDGDGSPLTYIETRNEQRSRVLSEEVQAFGNWGRGAEWIAGMFASREYGRDLNDVRLASGLYGALEGLPAQIDGSACAPPFASPGCAGNPYNQFFDLDLDVFNEIDIDSAAVYGRLRVPITARLRLLAGTRYTQDTKSYTLSIERLTANIFSVPRTTLRGSWHARTPMAALELEWPRHGLFYLSAARGFKSGGFNGRVNTNANEAQSFDPEFLWSYELGVKSEWLDRRLRLNAAVFRGNYDDLQFTATSLDPDSGAFIIVIDNVANAKIEGFEIETHARALPNFELGLGVGRTSFEFAAIDPAAIGISRDARQPRAPEWTAALTLRYEWTWTAARRMRLFADWSYESDSFADIANTPSIARRAHRLVDLSVAMTMPASGWEVAVSGTNLTDSRFIVNGVQALDSFGTAEGFPNRPREWSLAVRKRFW